MIWDANWKCFLENKEGHPRLNQQLGERILLECQVGVYYLIFLFKIMLLLKILCTCEMTFENGLQGEIVF